MLEQDLEDFMKYVSFHVLLLCASSVIAKSRYEDVHILGRRSPRQKSRSGGADILATSQVGFHNATTLFKVVQDDIRLRMVDELFGVTLRQGAVFGVLITPFGKTASVRKPGMVPPNLMIVDGPKLVRLMIATGVGVTVRGDRMAVDYAYFQALQDFSESTLAFIKKLRKESL